MKAVLSIVAVLLVTCAHSISANRLHARALKKDQENDASFSCNECPTDLANEAFASIECCTCADGWEIVSVDQSFAYCVESTVLLDETALRLLATFTGKLLEAYVDTDERDEEAGTTAAQKEGSVYVTQGTAADLIQRESGGDLPVFARVDTLNSRSGGTARYNKITQDLTVGAAQEANFVRIRTLFPFETRFQSLNDQRARTTFEDRSARHPAFRKITTSVNQNSAIEVAAVAFVPTFTVN